MKIKKRDKKTTEFFMACPKCEKEIKGSSATQVDYNMKVHLEKHKRQEKELKK